MPATTKIVSAVPSHKTREVKPRDSEAARIVQAAKDSPTGIIEVQDEPEPLDKLYRTLAQWRLRYEGTPHAIGLKRLGDKVFLWVAGAPGAPDATVRRRPPQS